ncbi:MAG: class I tRNA ligase family protein, partial [Bdellovibrionales bacterium]|nr:class I tRNA ligase family protein [Bdellovibrionales bacterium]
PFEKVHIHALIRDEHGQKMSKSKGNVINPLELIDEYGADALRFGLCALSVQGRDILLSTKKIEGARNFINKVWNAGKFIEHVCEDVEESTVRPTPTLTIHQWMLTELNKTVTLVRKNLEEMKFNEVADPLYHFAWHQYCDWYIELCKPHLYGTNAKEKEETQQILLYTYHTLLKLLHPIIPFVTETLWQHLPIHKTQKSIMLTGFPKPTENQDGFNITHFESVQQTITMIRTIRTQLKVQPSAKIHIHVWHNKNQEFTDFIQSHEIYIKSLANVDSIQYTAPPSKDNGGYDTQDGIEVYISLEGLIDLAEEISRLTKEQEKSKQDIDFLTKKLDNPQFTSKAPEKLVNETKEKLEKAIVEHKKIVQQLDNLK